MRHAAFLLASLLLGVLPMACSTSSTPELATSYEADLGRTSRPVIEEHVPRILDRHRYEIERIEDHQSSVYVYTRWARREPLDDEVALGYNQARTRITIEARVIGDSRATPNPAYRVRLRAENQLRRPMGADWEEPELTEMFTQYMDQLARDIKTEFESRFR
jgi:hypothetical protein